MSLRPNWCPSIRGGSGFQQAIEEGSITLQSDPQILGRDVFLPIPLGFEVVAHVGEGPGEVLHEIRDQSIRLAYRTAWFIYEFALDLFPAGEENFAIALFDEGHRSLGRKRRVAIKDDSVVCLGGLVCPCRRHV